MKKMRVVLIGSRPLSVECLKFILNFVNAGRVELDCIVTIPEKFEKNKWWDRDIKDFAKEKNLKTITMDKITDPDLIISVLVWCKISKEVLDKAKIGGINLHMAPLPRFRGSKTIAWAILEAEKEYGVTLHWMDEELDTGEIIEVKYFPIDERETAVSLYKKSEIEAAELFKKWFDRFVVCFENNCIGEIPRIKQDESKAKFYPKNLPLPEEINPEDDEIMKDRKRRIAWKRI